MYDNFRHEYLLPASRTTSRIPDSSPIWLLRSTTGSFSNSPFYSSLIFGLSTVTRLPNYFCPFFPPIKRRPQTKLLPTTFQLYDPPQCWTFLDDQRVLLRGSDLVKVDRTTTNVVTTGCVVMPRTTDVDGNSPMRCFQFKLLAYWDKFSLFISVNNNLEILKNPRSGSIRFYYLSWLDHHWSNSNSERALEIKIKTIIK